MEAYQSEFLNFAIDSGALQFGEFTLKSGRRSPYFFNTGLFNTGERLRRLGEYYAAALVASTIPFDMLYGPAYKGITLVAATAIGLASRHGLDRPYAFNRKEVKDHGEGGDIVGSPLAGRVVIVDDVISSGLSIRESADIICARGAELAGVCISFDRQERGSAARSAVAEIKDRFRVPIVSIASRRTLQAFLAAEPARAPLSAALDRYASDYGVEEKD